MKVLLHPQHLLSPSYSTFSNKPRKFTHAWDHPLQNVRLRDRDGWIRRKLRLTVKATLDSATIDQLGLSEFDVRNPALSTTYRSPALPKPNQTVLEAQARVCTGPTQTRPLGEEQAFKVLDTILRSGCVFFYLNMYLAYPLFVFFFCVCVVYFMIEKSMLLSLPWKIRLHMSSHSSLIHELLSNIKNACC